MPLDPDDELCLCFHVSLRKVENFCRQQHPRAASQISECLSAGTGCGWCIPMLRKIHRRICGNYIPFWKQDDDSDIAWHSPQRDASSDNIDHTDYAAGRQHYIAQTKRQPPSTDL